MARSLSAFILFHLFYFIDYIRYMKRLLCFFILFIFVGCSQLKPSVTMSTVESFHYGGYGDTTISFLFGQVSVLIDDKKFPLANTTLSVSNMPKSYVTDSAGRCIIGLYNGIYSISVNKQGYEPLLISNYKAHSDRVSDISILLVKGSVQRQYLIPDDKNTNE